MKTTTLVFDLDGVICEERPTFERALAKPIAGSREIINLLYSRGYKILIYTGRGWAEYEMTKDWLVKNGILFHQLIMGKPVGDVWIDDRAIEFKDWEDVWTRLEG